MHLITETAMQVMTWVSRYQESCRELGIEDDKLEFPKGRGLAMLIDKYIERIHQTLKTWFTNILEVCSCADHLLLLLLLLLSALLSSLEAGNFCWRARFSYMSS